MSRSLRKSCARFEIRVDHDFDQVIDACADRHRKGAWISRDIKKGYRRLHDLGWVHSVEAWSADGKLAGGLYGVSIGGLFAGESMFHWQTDASKVALVALVELLQAGGATLLDVQWLTPHLRVPRGGGRTPLDGTTSSSPAPWPGLRRRRFLRPLW